MASSYPSHPAVARTLPTVKSQIPLPLNRMGCGKGMLCNSGPSPNTPGSFCSCSLGSQLPRKDVQLPHWRDRLPGESHWKMPDNEGKHGSPVSRPLSPLPQQRHQTRVTPLGSFSPNRAVPAKTTWNRDLPSPRCPNCRIMSKRVFYTLTKTTKFGTVCYAAIGN